MRNKIVIITVTLLSLTLLITGCSSDREKLKNYNYMTSAYIEYGKDKYEINKCIDEDTIIIIKNKEIDKIIKNAEFIRPTEVLELPETDEVYNIKEKKKLMNMTWETTLDESGQYINYLKANGYTIEFQANTEAFIEIYLKNTREHSDIKYKRLVITSDTLIEADVDNILFKNVSNYII